LCIDVLRFVAIMHECREFWKSIPVHVSQIFAGGKGSSFE
jgi:hypothetical protein